MRIFHFGNSPFNIDQLRSGGLKINTSGGWITALLGRLLSDTNFSLAYASFGKTRKIVSLHGERIDCFVIPEKWGDSEQGLRACFGIVEQWKPDLIHIHGTERIYGLLIARGMVRCPAVISMQGLLGPCSEWYRYFGNRTLLDILRMHRWLEIPAMRGHWMGFLQIRSWAKREREIIAGNQYFMGRTEWDRAYVKALNPSATYYHEGRLLREPFWHKHWEIERAQTHRVIFTHAGHPRKGTEILLDAIRLLMPDYPDIKVCIAGTISHRSGYGRYLRRKLRELGQICIELGPLDAEQMVIELTNSHVFVSPSFIDNSPNAVSEAQLIGMPVISTYTGGLSSLITDGITGLFFPTGDPHTLGAKLREVFENDSLAVNLGSEARAVATQRHDSDSILQSILANYRDVIGHEKRY